LPLPPKFPTPSTPNHSAITKGLLNVRIGFGRIMLNKRQTKMKKWSGENAQQWSGRIRKLVFLLSERRKRKQWSEAV